MQCSKPRLASRPLVEKLESRLQPGSVITGQGSGWSLLADKLSIPGSDFMDPPELVSPFPSERSQPIQSSVPIEVVGTRRAIPVASPGAAGRESSSLPLRNVIANLAASLMNEGLWNASPASSLSIGPSAAAATFSFPQTPPSLAGVATLQPSPIGVAPAAQPAARPVLNAPLPASPSTPVAATGLGRRAVPAQLINLDTGTVQQLAGYRTTNLLSAIPSTLGGAAPVFGGNAGNQATINFLTYLGGATGPDAIQSVLVRKENGANVIYVAGSLTDHNGRTDAFVAKLTDGATKMVWGTTLTTATAGPDNAIGLALNGNLVYVAGSMADPMAAAQTDGFVAQLDAGTGQLGPTGMLANASLAAVRTDSAGTVYVAGSTPDSSNANQQDIAFLELSSDLATVLLQESIHFRSVTGLGANSSVATSSGLIVDDQGIAYLAGSVGIAGDPNHDTMPLFFRFNAAGNKIEWALAAPNLTPGPGGMGTALAFDPFGNVVVTGSFNNDTGTPLHQDLLLARVASKPLSSGGEVRVVDAWHWYVDDRSGGENAPRVGDWTGNSLVVLADGSSIVTGAVYDPAAPNHPPLSLPSNGVDVHLTHFTPTDDSTVSLQISGQGEPENLFGGSGTDVGNALALDPANSKNVYVVGSTNSTDLPTTPGVVQPTYSGRDTTGFLGQASVL